MKVAILTYSRAFNYGAILQSYALQKIIAEKGHECYQINYNPKAVKRQYSIIWPRSLTAIKRDIAYLLSIPKRRKLSRFRRKIKHTKVISKSKLSNLNDKFDRFIVGSDQVWNKICTNGDYSFFLDFVENSSKKYSYAASFGNADLTDEDCNIYSKYLESFNRISVREESGKTLVKQLIDREAELSVDPVFLLDRNAWDEFTYENNKKYIFLFQYVSNKQTIDSVERIAKKNGLELIIYSSSPYAFKQGRVVTNIGIEDFLSYIKNARLVITDSFHCSAFCIIFNIQFFSELRKDDPANTRLENLMKIFSIGERYFLSDLSNLMLQIDYEKVNKSVELKRIQSLKYIDSIFER